MKLWVDDLRKPPDITWNWAKSSHNAIWILEQVRRSTSSFKCEIMSLDHDLGGDDTTRPVVLWCCENNFWPEKVVVHSANPVGIEWLEGMIERYKA